MKRLLETYLPMWAKETVLRENRQLRRENRQLQAELARVQAYCRGLEMGLRAVRKEKSH